MLYPTLFLQLYKMAVFISLYLCASVSFNSYQLHCHRDLISLFIFTKFSSLNFSSNCILVLWCCVTGSICNQMRIITTFIYCYMHSTTVLVWWIVASSRLCKTPVLSSHSDWVMYEYQAVGTRCYFYYLSIRSSTFKDNQ